MQTKWGLEKEIDFHFHAGFLQIKTKFSEHSLQRNVQYTFSLAWKLDVSVVYKLRLYNLRQVRDTISY